MTGNDGDREDSWEDVADGEPLETEQLALNDEDEKLPWLESSDDDDYDDEGSDWGQTARLAILAVLALGAIVGGIYWATHRNPDPALVADGSIVPADDKPYKEAPKDPGGKTFDGTGDTSFAVSEGQTRPAPQAGAAPAAPASGGVGVQVGAFSSKDKAEAAWTQLGTKASGALSGVSHRVVQGTAEAGTVYRLQAVAPDAGAAQALCSKLKAAGISCQVK
jgi:SPOR domain